MPKPNAKKRRVNRVKGFASRGLFRRWKWVLIPVAVLLLIPAMQVAVVRFRVKGSAPRGHARVKGFASRHGESVLRRTRGSDHETPTLDSSTAWRRSLFTRQPRERSFYVVKGFASRGPVGLT